MTTTKFAERVANSERVNIEDLSVSDVVLSEGLAVEITGPAYIHHGDLYAYAGTIINADDIRDADGGFRWPFRGILAEDLSWTVQRREGVQVVRQIRSTMSPTAQAVVEAFEARDVAMREAYEAEGTPAERAADLRWAQAENAYRDASAAHRAARRAHGDNV